MKPRIHLVHGIHTCVGDKVVRGLLPYLADFQVFYPDYGWIAGLETRIANPLIVEAILPYVQAGDLFIGHSNGCAIGYDLMHRGAPFLGMTFINGALERNILRPANVKWIDVYFNEGDEITRVAQVAEEMGLVDKAWGELGHAGYEGKDPLITNINCGKETGLPAVSGHSDIFAPGKLDQGWGEFIRKRLNERLVQGEIASPAS